MKLSIEGILHKGGEDEITEELTKPFDIKLGLYNEKSIEKSTEY